MARLRDNLDSALGNIPTSSAESMQKKINEMKKALIDMNLDVVKYTDIYQKKLNKEKAKEDKKQQLDIYKSLYEGTNNPIEKLRLKMKMVATDFTGSLAKGINKISSTFGKSIDDYLRTYSKYMGTISSRIQGSGLTYSQLTGDISKNLATSPFVTQTDMLENVNKFVQSGITYNLELRSYIATISDRIASTFDAFDSSLLRIIKIQQADSTTARLGMEALLTNFLNENFGDTSYLSSGVSKNITGLLTEAESQMGYKGATEFEYVVQK